MQPLIELRNLPGIQRIRELSLNDKNYETPAGFDTWREINAVSIALFCITEDDTGLYEDDPR